MHCIIKPKFPFFDSIGTLALLNNISNARVSSLFLWNLTPDVKIIYRPLFRASELKQSLLLMFFSKQWCYLVLSFKILSYRRETDQTFIYFVLNFLDFGSHLMDCQIPIKHLKRVFSNENSFEGVKTLWQLHFLFDILLKVGLNCTILLLFQTTSVRHGSQY